MTTTTTDPFAKFKAAQREAWAVFVPVEISTTIPASELVKFAQVKSGQKVLDVACGTGVVAVTAACRGAKACGLDLSPVLLERARHNARVADVDIEFIEGDAEALPYPDASFDVVLSQFGHIFAPRPAVALKEMLRVLKAGGRIAFSTWPPEHFTGRMFTFIAGYLPPAPPGAEAPAPPALWGNPDIVRERLGALVTDVVFRTQRTGHGGAQPPPFSRRAGKDDRSTGQNRRLTGERTGQACAVAHRFRGDGPRNL